MDDELAQAVRAAAEEEALLNAIKHDSEADVGAIMGPMMADHPDFREHGDAIAPIVAEVVGKVNEMDAPTRRDRLESIAPDKLADLEAEDEGEDHPLPDLSGVEDGVRMRVAPNPNAPWHLGHARMGSVIGTYADRYDGWFACRFDDTDPATKRPDLAAYDAILEDLAYLGFEPDAIYRASDRLDTYYEYARTLIDAGGAYTCSCPQEEFSGLKNDGKACPHRDRDPADTHRQFDDMVDGEVNEGDRVLRVRTDITHKNPALRDWVAFRIVDRPHPREEVAAYRCWPMLDFQSAIDDHLLDITHIIRGIDLQDSAKRQGFLYEYFDWTYPEVIHWGHVQLDEYDLSLSASTIRSRVESGELTGWDDPRAPTIASLRRRGIKGEAITKSMIELGTSTSNVDLSMSQIYSHNRELIDADATRRFFVRDGVEIPLEGFEDAQASVPLHPDFPDRGDRQLGPSTSVFIEPADVPEEGNRCWLKGLGCVRHDGETLIATGEDLSVVREGDVPVIHWVPVEGSRPLTLWTMNGPRRGHVEVEITTEETNAVVQFERVGYARIDEHTPSETVAYFAHE